MPKFDPDKWLAISAMIVSVGTLAALAYQSMLMRDSERASKLPYLYVQLQSNDATNNIALANLGIGPALVDDVHIRYQGRDIASDAYDFYLSQRPEIVKPGSSVTSLGVDKVQHGRLIPAGTTIVMMSIGAKDNRRQMQDILRLFQIAEVPRLWYSDAGLTGSEGAVIDITYSSVYGEHWRVRSDRIVPEAF
jgi:hypothetical protein